jgi:hypothetical protein
MPCTQLAFMDENELARELEGKPDTDDGLNANCALYASTSSYTSLSIARPVEELKPIRPSSN